jgi:hypothetical protein
VLECNLASLLITCSLPYVHRSKPYHYHHQFHLLSAAGLFAPLKSLYIRAIRSVVVITNNIK